MRQPVAALERVRTTQDLDAILARFERYHPARIDLALDRVVRLLAALGDPHRHLPPVIHVAGTNGKGSTIAFLRAIYEAAGQRVSAYTSPHLVDFTERFVLAGEEISLGALCDLLEEADAANAGQPITEFEIVTAAAFLALSRTPTDIVLLETGLGGRFDATNVIDAPLATVITPIARDHEAFLGCDIATIAGEKAAIQKPGTPSIVAAQPPEAMQIIERAGKEIGALLYRAGVEWSADPHDGGFTYRSPSLSLTLSAPALAGPHQVVNAASAVACVDRCAAGKIDAAAIAAGLSSVRWRGRFEPLPNGALRDLVPADWRVWLDAGHNGAAGEALAETLRQINAEQPRPVHIVFAMLEDKDPVAFVGPLARFANSVTAVPLPNEVRGHDPQTSVAALTRAGITAGSVPTLEQALAALALIPRQAHVLICGSHAIVGAALRANSPTD